LKLTSLEPLEVDIQEATVAALDRLLMPPAMFFAYPAGVLELSGHQMARLTRHGLKRGMPDIWVFHRSVYCIELKRRGGSLSKTRLARTRRGAPRVLVGQEEIFPLLIATGAVAAIAVCTSVDDVLAQLARWQIPLRGFTGPSPSSGTVAHGRGPVSEQTRLAMVEGQRRRRDREAQRRRSRTIPQGPGERSNQDAGLSGDQPNEA
jgi:hypothetical protein